MKQYRKIIKTFDKSQIEILRQHNINVEVGDESIELELDLYQKLKPYIDGWKAIDVPGVQFTKKEILSAQYCIINRWKTCGYPMPDNDFTWLDNTYESWCSECGTPSLQKEDFRVKKLPQYPLWGLIWVYDEFFVRTDLYEKYFKPLNIECRSVRMYKNDSIADSYVQLVIPVIEEPLDLSSYSSQICSKCGERKYDAKILGFFPLQEHPLPHIYKSLEHFGDGALSSRKVFVSAEIRDVLINNKFLRLDCFVPCAYTINE